nr:hypothetical protein [Micromonospora parastrephiae]
MLREVGNRDRAAEELGRHECAIGNSERGNTIDVFQAEMLLHDTRLSVDDTAGARRAWRNARDAMHAMQNGGTPSMRKAVGDRGDTQS